MAGRRLNRVGTIAERFWQQVDKRGPDECWPWLGIRFKVGYGQFSHNGPKYAHRWSYEQANGRIPKGLVLDHTCHNVDPTCPGGKCAHRMCVNPAHLEPVTTAENFRRGRERLKS